MYRKPSAAGTRPPGPGPLDDPSEVCPVCKTLRYLNKDLVFLINPKCYHPMCGNCVNRLFAHGQNQCPHAGCNQKLRRQEFRVPKFDDLVVEREVDERRRVAKVFNQTADDFESLTAYNDYLDMVESLVFDLLSNDKAKREEADAMLKRYEAEHKAQIERGRRRGAAAEDRAKMLLAAEHDAALARRREAREQDREELRLKALAREADLDSLTQAPEGAASRVLVKKRDQHRLDALAASEARDLNKGGARAGGGIPPGGLSIRGLKEKKRPQIDGPYDPFAGLDLRPFRYQLQDEYRNEWLEPVKRQPAHIAGGYSLQEYYSRAMFEAFAGMGVFISDEKETGLGNGASAAAMATLGASLAATVVSVGRGGSSDQMDVDPR